MGEVVGVSFRAFSWGGWRFGTFDGVGVCPG